MESFTHSLIRFYRHFFVGKSPKKDFFYMVGKLNYDAHLVSLLENICTHKHLHRTSHQRDVGTVLKHMKH